ncbi:unnamed protein product [Caenorhabditis bovis]|uniref:G-protein coupled receptors family 1 profile domain-containing protein n=1 Tax=Caenorhabditis bovis TaxID=2654633 RepID=A0A8S1EJU4_9PELO|nr:unnamed protein product [Caenorhabditis bovis]
MENSTECLNLNEELWDFRADLSSRWPTMIIFAFLYLVIIAAGLIGNTCVVLAILRNKSLQTVPNLFIISLSCSDIVVCCTSATITPITAFKKEWIFGEGLCRVAPFIAGISLCFSTFTLTAISIDRYILIRFPMRKPISHYQALAIIGIICVFAATITSPIMFKQKLDKFANFCGEYCTESWGEKETHIRKLYGAILLLLQLVIPLTIIIICYTAISLRIGQSMILKGAKKQKADNWEVELSEQQRIAVKRRQRTNRMLIGMVVAFALSWIWSVTFNILRDYDYLPELIKNQEYIFGIATHCIAMTSTVWNPLLYAVLNLQLRAAFINLMPNWLRNRLKLECDTQSPLLNHTTNMTANKYGSTATQRLKATVVDTNQGNQIVSTIVEQIHRESNSFKIDSAIRKKSSVIRILVQKKKGEEEEHLIVRESPSPPNMEMQTLSVSDFPIPRRRSAQPRSNKKVVLPRKASF